MGNGCHLLQRQIAFEVFHNVLDDRVELPAREYAVRPARQPLRACDIPDQVNG